MLNRKRWVVLSMLVSAAVSAAASAQSVPWVIFDDPLSASICDVVNTANAELVVIADADPGIDRFAIVTGSDIILQDTEVLPSGEVLYLGEAAGIIDFATDDDGLRTLWWLSLDGRVIEVDTLSRPGEPTVTNTRPDDYRGVPCDACDFWDDQSVCQTDDDDDDEVTFRLCGTDVVVSMIMSVMGLGVLGLRSRR